MERVKGNVQLQYINSRFASDPQKWPIGCFINLTLHHSWRKISRLRHARNLQLGVFERDMRIESAARGSYGVSGHQNIGAEVVF